MMDNSLHSRDNHAISRTDIFENVHLPVVIKVIGIDGKEKVIDNPCIHDVFFHARRMVEDDKYTRIDLNDVITVLQSGENAVAIEIENKCTTDCVQLISTVLEFLHPLCVKSLLLHFQFTTASDQLFTNFNMVSETLSLHLNEETALSAYTDDRTGDKDSFTLTAIAIY